MVRLPAEDTTTQATTTKAPARKKTKEVTPAEGALKRFEETFGKKFGTVPSRKSTFTGYEVISTGSVVLDYKIGTGGLVVGRVHGFWGNPQSGKSTTAMRSVAAAQKKYPDKMCAWIDVENSFDEVWAVAMGVDMSRLYLVPGADIPTAEEQADAMYSFTTSSLISLLVIDSIGAMIPREEFEKDADEATVGTRAKIITRMVLKIAAKAPKHRTAIIMINQVRDIIGPKGGQTTGGGNAAKHVESMQLKFQENGTQLTITEDGKQRPVGKEIAVRVVKNKTAAAGAVAVITLVNKATQKHGPVGIDQPSEAFRVGKSSGVIKAEPGGYYTLPSGGDRIRGEESVTKYLREHPEEVVTIRAAALETLADSLIDDEPELHTLAAEADEVEDEPVVEGTPRGPQVVEDDPVELDGVTA